ncbi:MAG: hypothetical protein ABR508_10730 [Candidatus Baltobacteraceae bacterium]
MTRLFRIAGIAALIALSSIAHAGAQLDPARVFTRDSGSFLSALTPAARSVSLISASIFGERVAGDGIFLTAARAGFAAAYAGAGTVNLSLPHIRSSFEPAAAELAFSPPQVPDSQPTVLPPAAVAAPSSALRTPAPASAPGLPQGPHFGSYSSYAPAPGVLSGAPVDVRLGSVRFQTAFAAMQKCGTADDSAACAQGLSAGTAFNVRAGNRSVNLRLESGVTHLVNQSPVFPYVPLDPDAQAGLSYPGVTNVFGQNVGAQLAVPVTQRITVGLQYDRAHYQGNTATSVLPGFEGTRNTYLGNLTYQLKGSSAITLSARQYRYQDLLTPSLTATQTRADLNFTVKF